MVLRYLNDGTLMLICAKCSCAVQDGVCSICGQHEMTTCRECGTPVVMGVVDFEPFCSFGCSAEWHERELSL